MYDSPIRLGCRIVTTCDESVLSRREATATSLLSRVLRMRRATSDLVANLLDESIAYQLVWPN
jgi:hypothetical protein